MSNSFSDRVLAFAAICQSAKLVQAIARENSCDQDALATSLHSILVVDAEHTIDIFGDVAGLKEGLNGISEQLSDQQHKRNPEITRYLVGLLALERRLAKRPDMMAMLGERINQSQRQLSHFDLLEPQVMGGLADIYSDVISPLGPKIQVGGNVNYLQQSNNQHKIRALLLAGIRAAVLWRQLGGQRRQLLFSRKKYLKQAQQLLSRTH